MKLIINSATIRVGGAVQVAINIIKYSMTIQDMDVYYITNTVLFPLIGTDPQKTCVVDHSPANWKSFHVRKEIKKFEKTVSPDLIYSIGAPSYISFKQIEVLRLTNPWIINQRNIAYQVYSLSERLRIASKMYIQRRFIRKNKYFITQSFDAKEKIVRNLNKNENDIFVIPNIYSFNMEKYIGKVFIRDYSGDIRIAMVAAPYPHKNLSLAVKAAEIFKQNGIKNIKFILTYPENLFIDSNLYSEIINADVSDYFENVGKVSVQRMASLYVKAHLVFLPTVLEVFSVTLVEAMVFRLPIVTTGFSFNREVCKDAAFYIENPFDGDEAAAKILSLIGDPDMRNLLIDRGQKILSLMESNNSIYARHFDILRKISKRK